MVNSPEDMKHLIDRAKGLGRPWLGDRFAMEELEFMAHTFARKAEVFRFLCLPPDGLDGFDPQEGLGRHWTEDFSAPYTEVLNVPEEADGSWSFVLLKAEIEFASIDLVETLAARSALPWEKEIVLQDTAQVTLKAVFAWDETISGIGERLRPDLENEICMIGRTVSPLP